jgi:hypothetical protein
MTRTQKYLETQGTVKFGKIELTKTGIVLANGKYTDWLMV